MSQLFKNRILGYELVDPKSIKRNPLNWRTHPDSQRAAMRGALEELGYVDTCLVNKRTRTLIDGEMRLDLAEENQEPAVPVLWVDLSPEEERLALAIVNPMSELAGTDPEQLGKLLANREPVDGPLDEMLRALEEMAAGATVKPAEKRGSRATGRSPAGHTLRIVLSVPDVAGVERAIAATGIGNRGEALMEICRHYLEGHDDEAGQLDDQPQGELTDQLAEALRADAGHS